VALETELVKWHLSGVIVQVAMVGCHGGNGQPSGGELPDGGRVRRWQTGAASRRQKVCTIGNAGSS
jgi:hypothetical protein